MNKFFDIDANKQINEINGKKIKTENPYIKVVKSMSPSAGSSQDSLAEVIKSKHSSQNYKAKKEIEFP